MLFRALFWVGLVSMLMPREPDLGYGRPGPGADLTSGVLSWFHSGTETKAAEPKSRTVTTRSLAQVKAEIAAAVRQDNF